MHMSRCAHMCVWVRGSRLCFQLGHHSVGQRQHVLEHLPQGWGLEARTSGTTGVHGKGLTKAAFVGLGLRLTASRSRGRGGSENPIPPLGYNSIYL